MPCWLPALRRLVVFGTPPWVDCPRTACYGFPVTREDVLQWVALGLLFVGQLMLGRRINIHLEMFRIIQERFKRGGL